MNPYPSHDGVKKKYGPIILFIQPISVQNNTQLEWYNVFFFLIISSKNIIEQQKNVTNCLKLSNIVRKLKKKSHSKGSTKNNCLKMPYIFGHLQKFHILEGNVRNCQTLLTQAIHPWTQAFPSFWENRPPKKIPHGFEGKTACPIKSGSRSHSTT